AELLVAGLAKNPAARPSPSQLMRALAASAVIPAMAGRGAALGPAAAAPALGQQEPAWIGPPTVSPAPSRRTVPPLLAGALIALVVVIAVLLLRR
ncbi:MAG TPA: hypothetical protein VIM17_10265, partial [Jatrophihabitantaceae bacterium]